MINKVLEGTTLFYFYLVQFYKVLGQVSWKVVTCNMKLLWGGFVMKMCHQIKDLKIYWCMELFKKIILQSIGEGDN